jgi:hypothetical protein
MAAHKHEPSDLSATAGTDQTELDHNDPVGPITLPQRGRASARALALVGFSVGLTAAAFAAVTDSVEGTFTTISLN